MAKKKSRKRNPGLLFSATRVEIEDVTKRQTKRCEDCGELPEVRRLMVTEHGGQYPVDKVRCMACGGEWLVRLRIEVLRAVRYLRNGKDVVRL